MDWNLTITLLVVNAIIVGFIYGLLRNFKNIQKNFYTMDKHIERIEENLRTQSKRIDHIFEICIELLRQRK